jgi:hypothetical protein
MGYADHDGPEAADEPPSSLATRFNQALTIVVRLIGIAVLLFGLWAGAMVLLEGWALYERPQRIERFAEAIEHGSNLDAMFSSLAAPLPSAELAVPGEEGEEALLAQPAPATASAIRSEQPTLRLSYFAAWFVALMLLFVVGMLAVSAISAGGQLALREHPSGRISRDIVREVRRLRRAA